MNEAKKPARVLVVDDDARNLRLAVTSLAMKGDAGRLIKKGFDGYLEKPIRYKEFQASVTAGRPAREVILVHDFVPNLK